MASASAATDKPDIKANLAAVKSKISEKYAATDPATRALKPPRLLAVSKLHPKEAVIEAYEAGQREFGENYIQELVEKSTDAELMERCPDIRWHLIGRCQSKKASLLARTKNLSVVETVDSKHLADKLQYQCESRGLSFSVFVQVNTSGEENKGGAEPGDAVLDLVRHLRDACPSLKLAGVMTIGALAHSVAVEHEAGANPDFLKLIAVRKEIADELEVAPESLELSMGMSNDFGEAIRLGSTEVRVGTSIFGARKK